MTLFLNPLPPQNNYLAFGVLNFAAFAIEGTRELKRIQSGRHQKKKKKFRKVQKKMKNWVVH